MMFFFDKNLSEYLARGLQGFGENATHLIDHLPQNITDIEMFEFLDKNNMILITRDKAVRHNEAERKAIYKFKVGAFFLSGKNLDRWRMILQVVRNWEKIKDLSLKTTRPFAYRVPPNGIKIEKISL